MDPILADLLKTAGRSEQRIEDLHSAFAEFRSDQKIILEDHTQRIVRMENKWKKVAYWSSLILVPVGWLWTVLKGKTDNG